MSDETLSFKNKKINHSKSSTDKPQKSPHEQQNGVCS